MNVIVIGAGVIGHCVAYELASRGAKVRIVDPRGTGQGATRASAGVLAPYIEGHTGDLLRLAVSALDHYDTFMTRLRADSGEAVEFGRFGTLQVALGDADARELETVAHRLAGLQIPHTMLNAAGTRHQEPALGGRVTAGLLVPTHGHVGVASLMTALTAAAARYGVTVICARVQNVGVHRDGVRVMTSEGMLSAEAAVIAAGSWSGQIFTPPAPPSPVRPIRGQLLHLRFPQQPLSRVVWGTGCYLVPWRDGSVLVGATVEDVGFDEDATVEGVRFLLDRASELMPDVSTARFDSVRVGLRPATADELPVIGASSTMRGVFYATGHYRNGVLLAPLTAVMLADLVLDGRARSELGLVRPDRFGL